MENNKENKDIFWINDPYILFKKDDIFKLWPNDSMNKNEKLNAITRLIILLTLIGFILTRSLKILFTGILTVGIFVFLYYITNKNQTEGFFNNSDDSACNLTNLDKFDYISSINKAFTNPTSENPLMNVLLPEIQDNPTRKTAMPSYNPITTEKINNDTKQLIIDKMNLEGSQNVEKQLFNDLGDNMEFEQSMRQFYTTANTTIPNNQKDFADFCYGDMISCKEGNIIACSRNNPRHIGL